MSEVAVCPQMRQQVISSFLPVAFLKTFVSLHQVTIATVTYKYTEGS